MSLRARLHLKCKRCGGRKYIGEEYYAMGAVYIDVTCLHCAHSRDITVQKLELFLSKLEKLMK